MNIILTSILFKDLFFITLIKIKLLILDNYWNLVTIPGGWLVVG